MVLSSSYWVFLFSTVVVFWLLPLKLRLGFLALASFAFLVSLEPFGVMALILWTVLFFYVAPQAMRGKNYASLVLTGLVLAKLTDLIWHKYLPVFLQALDDAPTTVAVAAPLGISYFTFKLIHYAVEMSRGNIRDRSLPAFFCYIFLFPIFTAGPIERFDHFLSNITTDFRSSDQVEGLTRISYGLIKFLLVGRMLEGLLGFGLSGTSENLVNELSEIATWKVWAFLAVTYLYAYIDFSAYTDIAIGSSRLFGIRIMENFRFPILAVNITDFWRRWHMTLAGWCQSYIYLPVLARTRTPYAAVFATFTAMGLWHGATWGWLMWGLYHATGVALYVTWSRYARRFDWWIRASRGPARYLGLPITFAFVSGSYAFSSMGGEAGTSLRVFLALFGIGV